MQVCQVSLVCVLFFKLSVNVCIGEVTPHCTHIKKITDQPSSVCLGEKKKVKQFICPAFVFRPDLRDYLRCSEAIPSPWKLHFYCVWRNVHLKNAIIQTKTYL